MGTFDRSKSNHRSLFVNDVMVSSNVIEIRLGRAV